MSLMTVSHVLSNENGQATDWADYYDGLTSWRAAWLHTSMNRTSIRGAECRETVSAARIRPQDEQCLRKASATPDFVTSPLATPMMRWKRSASGIRTVTPFSSRKMRAATAPTRLLPSMNG